MKVTVNDIGDHVCEHGTAVDVHCCNCHSGFVFDLDHECPDEELVPHPFNTRTPYEPGDDRDIWCKDCEYHRDHRIHSADGVPWRDGPPICTNCGESAKPHPAYADFVGPFCEGCWDRLREYFTSGVICPVCKHEHDRETADCKTES